MDTAGNLATWFLLFLTYSVVGWCIEVISIMAIEHKFTNRGFLLGPLCPIYGIGAVVMSLLLANTSNIFEILLVSIGASAIIEYFTSYLMEKMFHVRWWDYSKRAFNIHGRVCLANLIAFGVMGVVVIKVVNPLLFALFGSMPVVLRVALASGLFILLLADLAVSLWLMIGCRATVGTVQLDATDEITAHVREILRGKHKIKGKLNRRLTKAFPGMTIDKTSATQARIHTAAKVQVKAVKTAAKAKAKNIKTQAKNTKTTKNKVELKNVKTAAKAQARAIKTQARVQAKAVSRKNNK